MSSAGKTYLHSNKSNRKKPFRNFLKISLISLLLLVLSTPLLCTIYIYNQLSKINIKPICKSDEALGIEPVAQENPMKDSIINIALLGTDRRRKNELGRSDTIIIATLDFKHKDVKLSSIMRDSYVKINKHGYNKITHAYVYGGPQLTLNTINKNFNLNIRDYISVDFFNLEKLIDIIGGVNIDIQKSEIRSLNKNMAELSHIEKSAYKKIKKPGIQKLNGNQALAYARIRDVGNGDYERTLRQRKLLMQLFAEISYINPAEYTNIVLNILPLIETSMPKSEILKYSSLLLCSDIKYFKQTRFPANNSFNERRIKGVDFIVPNIEKTKLQLHQFIFEDIYPQK